MVLKPYVNFYVPSTEKISLKTISELFFYCYAKKKNNNDETKFYDGSTMVPLE